jgi:hypothetical protein
MYTYTSARACTPIHVNTKGCVCAYVYIHVPLKIQYAHFHAQKIVALRNSIPIIRTHTCIHTCKYTMTYQGLQDRGLCAARGVMHEIHHHNHACK